MTVEESRQKLYMILEGVSLSEQEVNEAITTMMRAETAACRACAMAIDFLAEANRKVDALLTERDALKAQLEHIDHEWTRGVHSSGWGGVPVTNEQPPDRSEDGINERFFEAK